MPVTPSAIQSLQQALAHHASISEYVDDFSHAVPWLNEKDITRKINGMRSFLKIHVVDHFDFEDRQIFPQLLQTGSGSERERVIRLLQEAGKLNELLMQIDPSDAGEAALLANRSFREFLIKLQKHASQEDNLFLPLLPAPGGKAAPR